MNAIFRYTFVEGHPPVRDQAAFEKRLEERANLMDNANRVASILGLVLEKTLQIEKRLKEQANPNTAPVYADITRQLARLLAPGFMAHLPFKWLKEYPRYLKGIEYRLEKLQGNLARDEASRDVLAALEERYWQLDEAERGQLTYYRFLLEEFRVSLFAQPVGTSVSVSAKKLEKEWTSALEKVGL